MPVLLFFYCSFFGCTMHSLFGCSQARPELRCKRTVTLIFYGILIIDEFSFIQARIIHLLAQVCVRVPSHSQNNSNVRSYLNVARSLGNLTFACFRQADAMRQNGAGNYRQLCAWSEMRNGNGEKIQLFKIPTSLLVLHQIVHSIISATITGR